MIEHDLQELVMQLKQRVEALEQQHINVSLKILDSRLGADFPLPSFATPGSAAVDLRAMMERDITLQPGEHKLIPSGFAVNMPSEKHCAMILPRSGLGHKNGLVLRNLVGLIDSDYQGQIQMSIVNNGSEPFDIRVGDRIAQLMFTSVFQPAFEVVDEFQSVTGRGEGGFGHSGRK